MVFMSQGNSTIIPCSLQPMPIVTGSAFALHCCKAHAKINTKMGNSTPCKIVTHENLNMKLGRHDYVVDIKHHANFGWIRFSGGFSPNRWNITLLWLFWLSCFFSGSYIQFKPLGRFSRFIAQTTCFYARTVFFGVRTIDDVIWGNMSPKPAQKRRESAISSQIAKIFKLRYYQNYSTDLNQILHNDKDQQCHFAGGPTHAYKESNMADGRHIRNRKLAITP